MRSRRALFLLALLAFALRLALAAAGGCSSGPAPVMPRGPVNSSVPCLEACADSNTCRAQCQPVGNLPPPPGIMYQR